MFIRVHVLQRKTKEILNKYVNILVHVVHRIIIRVESNDIAFRKRPRIRRGIRDLAIK